ncbi:DUF4198 domain-containing protein [Planctomicrobium sp. SH661]|uniref:DUF4198 domain-containing protein n=1 Tax=Planctomicrobium sp. SH661 TaxID=3448124 RepID=UPI003F5BD892
MTGLIRFRVLLAAVLGFLHAACAWPVVAFAHDPWVETNAAVVRAGDSVFIDLKLGNHGNDHRDFKLAGKLDLDGSKLQVLLPNGQKFDMLDRLVDIGYAPNEGYWTGKFVGGSAGTYMVLHQMDKQVSHGRRVRSIKSAKCFFLADLLLDKLKDDSTVWKEPVGLPLEIVPVTHPVLFTGPGMPIEVKVLRNGVPLPDTKVSFIPQGETLAEGFDPAFERMTNAEGIASFTPKTGCRLLIVTYLKAPDEKTDEYDSTSYGATVQMLIPDVCPCCQ